MRFLHLADLHLGKALHKQSLLADQRFILQQILEIARTREIDAVLIVGGCLSAKRALCRRDDAVQ